MLRHPGAAIVLIVVLLGTFVQHANAQACNHQADACMDGGRTQCVEDVGADDRLCASPYQPKEISGRRRLVWECCTTCAITQPECYYPACHSGTSVNGGKLIVDGMCLDRCSIKFNGGIRYCGTGDSYEGGDSFDCSMCYASSTPAQTVVVAAYTYVGSFIGRDPDLPSSDPALGYGPQDYSYSVAECYDQCPSFEYFALQNSGWCSCDSSYENATRYGRSSDCAPIGQFNCNAMYQRVLPVHYSVQASGFCTLALTLEECTAIVKRKKAKELGASEATVYSTTCSGVDCAPGGCYQDFSQDNNFFYNSDGTGECLLTRQCYCSSASTATAASSSTDIPALTRQTPLAAQIWKKTLPFVAGFGLLAHAAWLGVTGTFYDVSKGCVGGYCQISRRVEKPMTWKVHFCINLIGGIVFVIFGVVITIDFLIS